MLLVQGFLKLYRMHPLYSFISLGPYLWRLRLPCRARLQIKNKKTMHFAVQAQDFVKVTRLRRSQIGNYSFRVVFLRCWIVLFHWDLQLQSGFKSSVFVTSLRQNVDFEESVWEWKLSKSFETLGEVTILDVLRKSDESLFQGRRSKLLRNLQSGWCFRGVESRC